MAKVVSVRDARIIALKHQELTSTQIAAAVGCTRNVVISVLHRYAPELTKSRGLVAEKPIRTLFDRCDELHARMDRVLAETRVK